MARRHVARVDNPPDWVTILADGRCLMLSAIASILAFLASGYWADFLMLWNRFSKRC